MIKKLGPKLESKLHQREFQENAMFCSVCSIILLSLFHYFVEKIQILYLPVSISDSVHQRANKALKTI